MIAKEKNQGLIWEPNLINQKKLSCLDCIHYNNKGLCNMSGELKTKIESIGQNIENLRGCL